MLYMFLKIFYVKGEGAHMFTIPPLITLNALHGYGLFFHPRTRVAVEKGQEGMQGFGWYVPLSYFEQDYLYIQGNNPTMKQKIILDRIKYVYTNAIAVTPQTQELFNATRKSKVIVLAALENI